MIAEALTPISAKENRRKQVRKLLDSSDLCAEASRLSNQFLEHLPELRTTLILDAKAALEGDPVAANLEEVI